tara:strand:+ start:340 stop:501 length:162 start_codon:yes stop_codon:yes gene_type:complete
MKKKKGYKIGGKVGKKGYRMGGKVGKKGFSKGGKAIAGASNYRRSRQGAEVNK